MPESIHVRQHSLVKRGSNSVSAAAPADSGAAARCLDAGAVNVPLHHGATTAVTDVELGDFFVVLGLVNLAAFQLLGVFLELRLVDRFKLAQFTIRGGTPSEDQAGEKQCGEIENLLHTARRVRSAGLLVKRPSRKTTENVIMSLKTSL